MTYRERAKQVQWVGKTPAELWLEIEEIIIAAVEEEREACAKIADEEGVVFRDDDSSIAARIRARPTASDR